MFTLPRLLDGHTMTEKARLHPDSMSISLKSEPCSTASMVLPETDAPIVVGDWVKVYAPNGETCVMYVKSVQTNYTTHARTVSLEHTFGLLSNTVIFGKKTYTASQNIKTVITDILSNQPSNATYWTINQCEFTTGQPWEFNNADIMSDLDSITDCVQDWVWTFDQTLLPWKMNLVKFATTASCEMRMSRNITGLNVTIDKSSMYTRVYPVGKSNKDISSVNNGVKYLDRNTDTYGIIAKVLTDQSISDPATLKAYGQAELKRNSEPVVTVSVDGLLLAELTGEPLDNLQLNKVCALPLPDYGTVINERIIEMSWQNAVANPDVVKITLANQRQTLSSIVKKSSGSGKKNTTAAGCQLADVDGEMLQIRTTVGPISDGWQAVVEGAEEGSEAYDKWAAIKVTPTQISNAVSNLKTGGGMKTSLKDDTYTIYAVTGLDTAKPTETALMSIGKKAINIGTLDSTVTTLGTDIKNVTKGVKGVGMIVSQSGTEYTISKATFNESTGSYTTGAAIFKVDTDKETINLGTGTSAITLNGAKIVSVSEGLYGKTVVTQDSDAWSVVSSNASNGKTAYDKWASITVTAAGINSVVGALNGKTVVTQGSDAWSVVSSNASNGKTAYDKWASITVTEANINSVVGGLKGKTVITQDSASWTAVVTNANNGNTAYALTSKLSVTAANINACVTDTNTIKGAYLRLSSKGALLQGSGGASVNIKASNLIAGTIDGTTTTLDSLISTASGSVRIKSTCVNVGASGNYDSLDSLITTAPGEVQLRSSKVAYKRTDGTYTTMQAEIKLQTDNITLKVSKNGVISSINQTPENITIQASKINLSGYVTASDLSATNAKITNLTSGATQASTLKTKMLNVAEGFTYKTHACAFRTITVDGTTYHVLSY